MLTALTASIAAVALFYAKRSCPKYLALATTPLLWPLAKQAYMLEASIDGTITANEIDINPHISLVTEYADSTPRPAIEGPIVSLIGLIIATGAATVLLTKYLAKPMKG